MSTDSPIAFALDFPNLADALHFVDSNQLGPLIGAVKVGLELFVANGPQAVKAFWGIPVILDLKLHDIPATVERAVKAGGDLGVKYMTLHIQQHAALEVAVRAAEPFKMTLLGVTVLTSMAVEDFQDLAYDYDGRDLRGISVVEYRVRQLALFGESWGLKGFVCSPQEVKRLREDLPEAFFLVPGVRSGTAGKDDQKRTGTPREAILDGASMIVVGRQIRDAADPKQAALDILTEIKS